MADLDYSQFEDNEELDYSQFEGPTGLTSDDPLQERGVSVYERLALMNSAPSPQSAVKWLEDRGYDAKQYGEGYRIAVKPKKKANAKWKVVDPEGADWLDAFDIMGETAVGVASGVGGTIGAAGGSYATPLGTVWGAAKGGAIGGAIGESARQGLGALLGFEADLVGERAKDVFFEGVLGGVAGAGGQVVKQVAPKVVRGVGNVIKGTGDKAAKVGGKVTELTGALAEFPEQALAKGVESSRLMKSAVSKQLARPFTWKGQKEMLSDLAKHAERYKTVPLVRELVNKASTDLARSGGRMATLAERKVAQETIGKRLVPNLEKILGADDALVTHTKFAFGLAPDAAEAGLKTLPSEGAGGVIGMIGRGGAGYVAGGPTGAAISIAGPPVAGFIGRGLKGLGRAFIDDPSILRNLARIAPPKIAKVLNLAITAEQRGQTALTSAVYLIMNNADLRAWLLSEEGQQALQPEQGLPEDFWEGYER